MSNKEKRVSFEFDERSLIDWDEMEDMCEKIEIRDPRTREVNWIYITNENGMHETVMHISRRCN